MKSTNYLLLFINLILCFLTSSLLKAQTPQWLQRSDQFNTGFSPNKGPNTNARVEWQYQLNNKPYFNKTTPAIDQNGLLYTQDINRLYAINPDRNVSWTYLFNSPSSYNFYLLNAVPAISNTGTILTHNNSKDLYAINPDGSLKWKFTAEEDNLDAQFSGAVIIDKNDKIYAQVTYYVGTYTTGSTLYIINPDGSVHHKLVQHKELVGNISIGTDGSIYAAYIASGHRSDNYSLVIYNPDYSERITYNASRDNYVASPMLSHDGSKLYYNFGDKFIVRRISDLSILWENTTTGHSYALDKTDNLYIVDYYELHALNALTGAINWTANISDYIGFYGGTLIVDDQTIFVCNNGVLAFNKNGEVKWKDKKNYETYGIPTIGTNHNIYTITESSKLYAYQQGVPNQWPMFRYDNTASAVCNNAGIQSAVQSWAFKTNAEVYTTPVIDGIGNQYCGSLDGKFYCLASNGTLKWAFQTGGEIHSSAAISNNGSTIYVGSKDYFLYAFNVNGTIKWKFKTNGPIEVSPILNNDGNIIVGANDGCLYTISPNGILISKFCKTGKVITAAVVDNQGVTYVGINNTLYAINPDMTQKWACNAFDLPLGASPVLNWNQAIVYYCDNNKVFGINTEDGSVLWQSISTPLGISATPATSAGDVNIIIATIDGHIWKMNGYDGSISWIYNTYSICKSSPIVGADYTVYAPTAYNKVFALDYSYGEEKFIYNQNDGNNHFHSSPAMDKEGNLYFGSTSGNIYKLTNQSNARVALFDTTTATSFNISMYPNPVQDELTILTSNIHCKVTLTNMMGTALFVEENFLNGTIATTELPKGLYLVTVAPMTNPSNRIVKKIIIE
jgi:outer membrane protein assembly factor BamB